MKGNLRRTLSMMLVLCMVIGIFPIMSFAEKPANVTMYINDTVLNDDAVRAEGAVYRTIGGAARKAVNGDIIKLNANYSDPTGNSDYKIIQNKIITFDFNGYEYTSNYDMNNSYAMYALVGGEIRVIDSSTNKTGKLIVKADASGNYNDYGFFAAGQASTTPPGEVTIIDGNVPIGYNSGGKISFGEGITVEVPAVAANKTGKPVYAIQTGDEGTAYIEGKFTTNGYLGTGYSSAIRVKQGVQKNITCSGFDGMIAIMLAEDTKLTENLDTGICRLLTPLNKIINLDLNGYNITGEYGNIYVNPSSTLNITNSGTTQSQIINSKSISSIYNRTDQVWNGIAIDSIHNASTLTIGGNIKIENRAIKSDNTVPTPFAIFQESGSYANSHLTINDGVEVYGYGGAVVSNLEYESKDPQHFRSSTVVINGGTFRAYYDPISVPAGSLKIKNAKIDGNFGIWMGSFPLTPPPPGFPEYPENLFPVSNVDITAKGTAIAITCSTQSGESSTDPFVLKNIQVNKASPTITPNQNGILNATAHDIYLSGKDTYINADPIMYNDLGPFTGTGKLIITGGIYSAVPTSYLPDNDNNGIKDYATLILADSPTRYLVAPWTEVGTDNNGAFYYPIGSTDATVSTDGVDINAINDTEYIVSDPTMVQAKHFTLSSDANNFSGITGLDVSKFNGGNRLTISKTKACNANIAYVWYGGRSVGQITLNSTNEVSYDVDGTITSDIGIPTAKLVRNGVVYDATVTSKGGSQYYYIQTNVPSGIYNLVVTVANATYNSTPLGTVVVTELVTVTNANVTKNAALPTGAINSTVTVKPATTPANQTPNTEAGGLDTAATTVGTMPANVTKKVLIDLSVQENENAGDAGHADAIKNLITADGKTKGVVMDVDLTKSIQDGSNPPVVTEITEVKSTELGVTHIEAVFHLPKDIAGKSSYVLYRNHNGTVQKITETPNAEGEYIVVSDDATRITAKLKYFSAYAIAYNEPLVDNTNKIIYANGTALYIDDTGVYIDLNRNGILDDGEPSLIVSANLSEYTIYGGFENGDFTGNTLITQVSGNVKALNGGSATGQVTGNAEINIRGGISGTVSGGASVTGTNTVAVSGNPTVTGGINLATLDGKKVIINGYLNNFTSKIALINPSAISANTVVASATNPLYLKSSNGFSKASEAFSLNGSGLDITNGANSKYDVIITNINAGLKIYAVANDNVALDSSITSDRKHYNVGDRITVDIYAKSTIAFKANSYQFRLDYPKSLTLNGITSNYTGSSQQNGDAFVFAFNSANDNIPVNNNGIKIAEVTFTLTSPVTDGTIAGINVKANSDKFVLGMGEQGTVNIVAGLLATSYVTLHDMKVKLNSTANAKFDAAPSTSKTAYVRYGTKDGLFTDNTYATGYTFPTITASDKYRLGDKGNNLWVKTADGTTKILDNTALSNLVYTASAEFDVLTTSTVKISFDKTITGGSLSDNKDIIVDDDSTFADVKKLPEFPTAIPEPGYEFDKWVKVDGVNPTTDISDTTIFTDDTIIKPIFKIASYTLKDSTDTTVTLTKGVGMTGTASPYGVAYNNEVKFSLAPVDTANDCYYISGVTVTIGGVPYTGYTTGVIAENGAREITIPGNAITGNIVVTAASVKYHTVIFNADNGVNMADGWSQTAYVIDGGNKLFTTIAKAVINNGNADFTMTALTAKPTYRMYHDTKYWKQATNTYNDFTAISAMQITANTTWTATSVQTYVITPVAGNGGTIANTTPITVDAGTLFRDVIMPSYKANNTGWAFVGWQDRTQTPAIQYGDNTPINGNVTLTAVFAENEFNLTTTKNNSTVAYTAGTTNNNTKVKQGTDIKFTATADPGYVITGVSYTVVGANGGASVSLTPQNNVYTILGTNIIGDVNVIITTLKYHTITFQQGTGNTMTTATAYVQDGGSVLFTSVANLVTATSNTTSDFDVPKPVQATNYRLAKDTAAEPLWSNNGDNAGEVTTTNIGVTKNYPSGKTVYKNDVTYTAYAIRQYTVSFTAGANGTLNGVSSVIKDENSTITAADIPTPVANTHYEFNVWTDSEPFGATVTGDKTYTATFKIKAYNISFEAGSVGAFTAGTGITTVIAPNGTITNGTNAEFTFAKNANYGNLSIKYTLDGTNYTTINEVNGKYTILGTAITGNITVIASANGTHLINFVSSNDTFGTLNGTKSFTIDDATSVGTNKSLTQNNLNDTGRTSKTGYEFKHWKIGNTNYTDDQLKALTFTKSTTITAVFGLKDAKIADPGKIIIGTPTGLSNNFDNIPYTEPTGYGYGHYGTDVTFKVTTDKIVSAVYYQVAGGAKVKITPIIDNANNVTYTIPGVAITGDIEVTSDTVTGTFEFILRPEYKAIVTENLGKKIAVFNTAKLTNGRKYVLSDGREFYWSDRYSAYVIWVDDSVTADSIVVDITTASGNAIEIAYGGDIDGDGVVTAADAGFINDCLHNQRIYGTLDIQLFRLDMSGAGTGIYTNTNSWKFTSVTDIEWVLDEAVGLH